MPNPYGVPELSPAEVAERLRRGDNFVLVDVREPYELQMANLGADVELVPVSALVRAGPEALPPAAAEIEADIVIFCHHGIRSAQVAAWLLRRGWKRVTHMAGGIDAYAREVDPEVGFY